MKRRRNSKARASRRLQRTGTQPGVSELSKRFVHLEAVVGKLTRTRVDVRREEHDEVLNALDQLRKHTDDLERHTRELEVQFRRIAQIQADLDNVKRAWERMKASQ